MKHAEGPAQPQKDLADETILKLLSAFGSRAQRLRAAESSRDVIPRITQKYL